MIHFYDIMSNSLKQQFQSIKSERDTLTSQPDKLQDKYNKLNSERVKQKQRIKLLSIENSDLQIKVNELTQKLMPQDQLTDSSTELPVHKEQIQLYNLNDKIIQDLSIKLQISFEQSEAFKRQLEDQIKRSALKLDLQNQQQQKIYQLEKANVILQQKLLKLEQQQQTLPSLEQQLEEKEQKIKELTILSGGANYDAKQIQINFEQLNKEIKEALIIKHQIQLEQLQHTYQQQQDQDSEYIQQQKLFQYQLRISLERQKCLSQNELIQENVDFLEGQIEQLVSKSIKSQEKVDSMVQISKIQNEKIQQLEIQIDEQKSLLSQYKMLSKSQVDDHIDEDMILMHKHLEDHSPENLIRQIREKVSVINEIEKSIIILKRELFQSEPNEFNSSRRANSVVIPSFMSNSEIRSKEDTHKQYEQINQKSMRTSCMISNRLDYTASQKKLNIKLVTDNILFDQ